MITTALAAPPSIDEAITHHRAQIDQIDENLLLLIVRRLEHAAEIGSLKQRGGIPVHQKARECAIVAGLCARACGRLRDHHIAAIWQALFRASREAQQTPSVAFLGPSGTFTELAMLRYFGDAVQAHARDTLEGVFAALADDSTGYAVVPVENSTEGTVTRTVDLLAAQPAPITGEIVLPVAHCLLGASGSLDGIGSVLGHPQALAQCRTWLDAHVPGLRRIPVSSSAIAAREAASLPECAAIAGEMASSRYGLRFIARAIQDDPENRTRFLVVGGPSAEPTGNDRTSIALTLDDAVGALASVFDALARHRVPVLWLEVRPGHEAGWAYRFFVDLGGHAQDANVSAALDEIVGVARDLRMLGAYPRALRVESTRAVTAAS